MNTLLSGLPILAVVVSLLAGISALRAAWLGLAATLLAVVLAFPVAPSSIWPAVVRWTPIVLEVLLIIGGGLWMSQVLQHSGAQADLARWIRDRAGPGIGTVLLIVHGITPFAESMTGFGIGITIGIPLLAHAGLPPRDRASGTFHRALGVHGARNPDRGQHGRALFLRSGHGVGPLQRAALRGDRCGGCLAGSGTA